MTGSKRNDRSDLGSRNRKKESLAKRAPLPDIREFETAEEYVEAICRSRKIVRSDLVRPVSLSNLIDLCRLGDISSMRISEGRRVLSALQDNLTEIVGDEQEAVGISVGILHKEAKNALPVSREFMEQVVGFRL